MSLDYCTDLTRQSRKRLSGCGSACWPACVREENSGSCESAKLKLVKLRIVCRSAAEGLRLGVNLQRPSTSADDGDTHCTSLSHATLDAELLTRGRTPIDENDTAIETLFKDPWRKETQPQQAPSASMADRFPSLDEFDAGKTT